MLHYFSTLVILVTMAIALAACGVRNAPTYNYKDSEVERYRYAPLYPVEEPEIKTPGAGLF